MAIVNEEDGFTQLVKLNITDTLLIQGEPVLATSEMLSEGQVIKFDAATNSFVYAGATVDETTGVWTFDNSIEVPQASLKMSDTLILTEGTGVLISTDTINDVESEHVTGTITDAGSGHPGILELSNQIDVPFQPDNSTQITTNPLTTQITSSARAHVNGATFEAFAAMSNVRVTITDNASGIVIMYLPNKAVVRDGVGGFEFRAGTNFVNVNSNEASDPSNGIFNIGISPFRISAGQVIDFLIEADNVAFLGDVSGAPFLENKLQVGIDRDIAYIRDTSMIAEDYIKVNKDYTTVSAKTGGLVVNFLPTSTTDTITLGQFLAGVASTSNPTVATVSATAFSATDLIQISGTQQNDGLYEVLTHAANVLTIKGVGTTANVEDFTQDDFVNQIDSGVVTKVNISAIRAGVDGLWEEGSGNQTPIIYTDFGIQNTIYNSDDEVSGDRQVTANSNRSVVIFGYNTNQATYTTRGGLFTDGASASLSSLTSTGGDAGVTGSRSITTDENGIFVDDDLSTKGIEGRGDYSANYDNLTYTQKIYVDATIAENSFYQSDGSFTANRQVDVFSTSIGGNDAEVDIYCFNTTEASPNSWTERGRLELSKFGAAISYDTGDGVGGFTGNNLLNAASDGVIYESTSFFPMRYDQDSATYVTNMSADVKSIPNVRWVNENTFYGKDATLNNTIRNVTFEGTSQLSFVNATPTLATFTDQTSFEQNSGSLLWRHAQGDGIGGTTGESRVTISGSSMLITDTINTKGLLGAADFSANYDSNSYVQESYVKPRSGEVICVQSEADFPTAVSGVITIGGSDTYEIIENFTMSTGTRFELNGDVFFKGQGFNTTNFVADSSATFITLNGDYRIEMVDMQIQQDGTGALMDIDAINLTSEFRNVRFQGNSTGGEIILRNGRTWLETNCYHYQAAGHRMVASGGMGNLIFTQVAWEDQLTTQDMFTYEDAHTTTRVSFNTCLFLLTGSGSRGKVLEGTPVISIWEQDGGNDIPFDATTISYDIEDTTSVAQGSIDGTLVQGPGTFLVSSPFASSSISTPATTPSGVALRPDGDLISLDRVTDLIYLHDGITTTIQTSIASPGIQPRGVVWHDGNLYSVDNSSDVVSQHDGFTTTILSSVDMTVATSGIFDLAFIGGDIVLCSATDDLVYIMDGFSNTIKRTITPDWATPDLQAATYDGFSLLIYDGTLDEVFVVDPNAGTSKYSFSAIAGAEGMGYHGDTLVIITPAGDTVQIYDTPPVFDNATPNWQISNVPGVINSSDRGGSEYSNFSGVALTPPSIGAWFDIDDVSADISYHEFSENEKCFLNNESNGEVIWTGAINRGRTLTAQVLLDRIGSVSDVFIDAVVAISRDGGITFQEQLDSVGTGVLPTNTDFVSVATIPLVSDLVSGDIVKVRVRNNSTTDNLTFYSVRLSIS